MKSTKTSYKSEGILSFYNDKIFPRLKNRTIQYRLDLNKNKKVSLYYHFDKDELFLSTKKSKSPRNACLVASIEDPDLYFNQSGSFIDQESEDAFFEKVEETVSEKAKEISLKELTNQDIDTFISSVSTNQLIYSLNHSEKYFGFFDKEDIDKGDLIVNILNKGEGYIHKMLNQKKIFIDFDKSPEERIDYFVSFLPNEIKECLKEALKREVDFINSLDKESRMLILLFSFLKRLPPTSAFAYYFGMKMIDYHYSFNIGYFAITKEDIEQFNKETKVEFINSIKSEYLSQRQDLCGQDKYELIDSLLKKKSYILFILRKLSRKMNQRSLLLFLRQIGQSGVLSDYVVEDKGKLVVDLDKFINNINFFKFILNN